MQRLTTTAHQTIEMSKEHKAAIAMMTDTEFQEWFCRYIAFMSNTIDPRSLAVHARIVETMKAWCDLPVSVASRLYLAKNLYGTKAYQRLFAETAEISA